MRFSSHLSLFALILLVLAGLSIVQAAHYCPQLPDKVASHFDWRGNPDGWMDRHTFCLIGTITILITVGITGGIGLIAAAVHAAKASRQSGVESADDLNREKSQVILIRLVGLWLPFLLGIVLLTIMQFAFQANLRTPQTLGPLLTPILIGYLLAIGLVGAWKVRQAMRLLPPRAVPADVWFPAKRFGWGWGLPIRWQGWLAMIVWLGIFFSMLPRLLHNPAALLLFLAVMIAALLGLCWYKGERPRWRWGE